MFLLNLHKYDRIYKNYDIIVTEVNSMGEKWAFIPTNKEKLEDIEVLVNENSYQGLFVQYNGIHVDRLHEFFSLNEGAKYFTTKGFHNSSDERMVFTDSHGRRVESTNFDAVFMGFESDNQNEIEEMIKRLAYNCMNQDLNINMTVHLNNEQFKIVSDKDDIEYTSVGDGNKGMSDDQFNLLCQKMNELKETHHKR